MEKELSRNLQQVLQILDARADDSASDVHAKTAYQSAADMLRYAIDGNTECLAQFVDDRVVGKRVKNMASDLSDEQLDIVLEALNANEECEFAGKTLREFIQSEWRKKPSLTDLMNTMEIHNLKWPFYYVDVQVRVELDRIFRIAVLDSETIARLNTSELHVDDLDPDFSLDEASYNLVVNAAETGWVQECTVFNAEGEPFDDLK